MPVSPHSRLTRGLLAVVAGATLAFLYLPIAFLILFSFEKADTPGFPITGLTLHWYEAMLADNAIHSALFNSVLVAVIVGDPGDDHRDDGRLPARPRRHPLPGHGPDPVHAADHDPGRPASGLGLLVFITLLGISSSGCTR